MAVSAFFNLVKRRCHLVKRIFKFQLKVTFCVESQSSAQENGSTVLSFQLELFSNTCISFLRVCQQMP